MKKFLLFCGMIILMLGCDSKTSTQRHIDNLEDALKNRNAERAAYYLEKINNDYEQGKVTNKQDRQIDEFDDIYKHTWNEAERIFEDNQPAH